MKKRYLIGMVIGTVMCAMVGIANATLMDRGGGLIYDTDNNLTWLRDANYAKTSGYDADGLMNWNQANTWANNLVYQGYDDWRLPSSNSQYNWSTTSNSEMGHLCNYEGIHGAYDGNPYVPGDPGPFINLYGGYNTKDAGWWFYFGPAEVGGAYGNNYGSYREWGTWAVRTGDSTPVPEPGTMLLLGSGLIGLGGYGRKKFFKK